jgi:hypothetical protein
MAHLILPEAGVKNGEIAMNPEQIKDEIRKLNWIDKIGIYRWMRKWQAIAGSERTGRFRFGKRSNGLQGSRTRPVSKNSSINRPVLSYFCPFRPARLAMTANSSAGSTGFAKCV